MLNDRRDAAQQIANRLIAAELALDKAVSEAAALVGYMPQARVEANLAAEVGHDALEFGAAAVATLIKARSEILETHRALARAKCQAGLREVALGGLMQKAATENVPLALVSDAA